MGQGGEAALVGDGGRGHTVRIAICGHGRVRNPDGFRRRAALVGAAVPERRTGDGDMGSESVAYGLQQELNLEGDSQLAGPSVAYRGAPEKGAGRNARYPAGWDTYRPARGLLLSAMFIMAPERSP